MGRNWRITTDEDYLIHQAVNEIKEQFGDTVSVERKKKSLHKFGRNVAVGTALATLAAMPGSETSETYLVGDIYVYEDDTDSAGVPDNDEKVHLMIPAGHNQTQKASTTMSNVDYWIITGFYIDLLERAVGYCNAEMQIRLPGKVFRERVSISATSSGRGFHNFNPYYICPKNSDIRVRAIADKINTEVSGGIDGFLAQVVGAAVN